MSKDNGIYILQTKGNEFRVVHAQAIENIYFWENRFGHSVYKEEANPVELEKYFGKSQVFDNKVDANKKALDLWEQIMNSDCPIVEYGIQDISLPNLEFPNGRT